MLPVRPREIITFHVYKLRVFTCYFFRHPQCVPSPGFAIIVSVTKVPVIEERGVLLRHHELGAHGNVSLSALHVLVLPQWFQGPQDNLIKIQVHSTIFWKRKRTSEILHKSQFELLHVSTNRNEVYTFVQCLFIGNFETQCLFPLSTSASVTTLIVHRQQRSIGAVPFHHQYPDIPSEQIFTGLSFCKWIDFTTQILTNNKVTGHILKLFQLRLLAVNPG